MELDHAINRAITQLHLIERAVHDPAISWSLEWAGQVVPALVEVSGDGISLVATFGDVCHLVDPEPLVKVYADGDLTMVHPLHEGVGDGAVTMTLNLKVMHSLAPIG